MTQTSTILRFLTYVGCFIILYHVYTWKDEWILFSNHPLFMTISFICMIEGTICILEPLSTTLRRRAKINRHYNLQCMSIISLSLGFAAIYYNKERNGSNHFTSYHGQLGFVTFTSACIQSFLGSFLMYPMLQSCIGRSNVPFIRNIHLWFSWLVILFMCIELVFAMYTGWAFKNIRTEGLRYIVVCCIIVLPMLIQSSYMSFKK